MRWQLITGPAEPAAARIKHLLAKPFDLAHQGVDLLLLANDDLIELFQQVFREAGLDFPLGQAAVGRVGWVGLVGSLGCIAVLDTKPTKISACGVWSTVSKNNRWLQCCQRWAGAQYR